MYLSYFSAERNEDLKKWLFQSQRSCKWWRQDLEHTYIDLSFLLWRARPTSWSFCIPSQMGPTPGTWQGLNKLLTNEQEQRRSHVSVLPLTLPLKTSSRSGRSHCPQAAPSELLRPIEQRGSPQSTQMSPFFAYQGPSYWYLPTGPLSAVYLESWVCTSKLHQSPRLKKKKKEILSQLRLDSSGIIKVPPKS